MDKYSELRVTSLQRCPSGSFNSIAGSDEVLYRPIGTIQVFLIADYEPIEQPMIDGRNS
jgi:hypothetical protein